MPNTLRDRIFRSPLSRTRDIGKMVDEIRRRTGNHDGEVLPELSTEAIESNFLVTPQMAAFTKAGKETHPAFGCLGKLYAANARAAATTASILYKNHWGEEKKDIKYLNKLLKKTGVTYLRILKEQVELLPMEDAQPGNYEIVPEDSEEHAHMDPETGEFVAPPRKVISEYDRYGRNIGDRVEHMLEKVFINCQLPTESDIEYMSNACGLSAQAIRGWWAVRGGSCLSARKLLKMVV